MSVEIYNIKKKEKRGPLMIIAVSACLIGENVKYNGKNNYSEKLIKFLEGHTVIPVCPEVLGGLSVPRPPCEIINGLVTNNEGKVVDKEFRSGAEKALDVLLKKKVELVILQSRSPSCGVNEIYDGTFSGKKIPGKGVFAQMLYTNNIKTIDIENLLKISRSRRVFL